MIRAVRSRDLTGFEPAYSQQENEAVCCGFLCPVARLLAFHVSIAIRTAAETGRFA